MKRPIVSIIAAVARNGAIGRDGGLVVHLGEDLRHFRRTTMGHPIVMGRRTWDSIGRPLPGRRNIVVTRNAGWHAEGAERAGSLDEALAGLADVDRAYVIGGAQLYAQALPLADELLLTEIDAAFDADTWFPEWQRSDFVETAREPHRSDEGLDFSFVAYRRKAER
jgi:dihydrofolate reductase